MVLTLGSITTTNLSADMASFFRTGNTFIPVRLAFSTCYPRPALALIVSNEDSQRSVADSDMDLEPAISWKYREKIATLIYAYCMFEGFPCYGGSYVTSPPWNIEWVTPTFQVNLQIHIYVSDSRQTSI